jgi:hypothetical protein
VATKEQNAWIKQALGIDVGGQDAASPAIDVSTLWREAKEATDQRLGLLAGKLRDTGDPDLVRIADFGLFGISGGGKGVNVALNKAMIEYAGSGTDKRPHAAQQLRKAVQQYRATLASNEAVRLVDNNPFGVNVAVATTLGAALEQIERALP